MAAPKGDDAPVGILDFGTCEAELDQIGDRWLAKVTVSAVARERIITEPRQRRAIEAYMNAKRVREFGVRLQRLADAIEALDADDSERLARIVASLREDEPGEDSEEDHGGE